MTLEEIREIRSLKRKDGLPSAVWSDDFNTIFDLAEAMLMLEEMGRHHGPPLDLSRVLSGDTEEWRLQAPLKKPIAEWTAAAALRAAYEEWKKW